MDPFLFIYEMKSFITNISHVIFNFTPYKKFFLSDRVVRIHETDTELQSGSQVPTPCSRISERDTLSVEHLGRRMRPGLFVCPVWPGEPHPNTTKKKSITSGLKTYWLLAFYSHHLARLVFLSRRPGVQLWCPSLQQKVPRGGSGCETERSFLSMFFCWALAVGAGSLGGGEKKNLLKCGYDCLGDDARPSLCGDCNVKLDERQCIVTGKFHFMKDHFFLRSLMNLYTNDTDLPALNLAT